METRPHLKISDEELGEYTETFHLFDVDGDGFITTDNLGQMLRSLGQNPTESELQDMILTFDVDGNGKLDFREFCDMMNNWKQLTSSEEELLLAFRVFDRNCSGFISLDELQEVLQNVGETFTDSYIEEIFHEVDQDCDGVISYEEFLLIMK